MMKMKSALKALKKRWVISILLLIQFTFGLSTITGSVNVFYNLFYLKNNSLLDLTSTYLITSKNPEVADERKFKKEQAEQIFNKLKKNKDVISYGTYYEEFLPVAASSVPLNSKLLSELNQTNLGMDKPAIRAIVIDGNYNQLLNLQVEQGKRFSAQDFTYNQNEKTNILVGSYFKKYFRIGDVINNQYTIIGFLPKDKYIVNNNTTNTYLKLDKAAVMPMPADINNNYAAMFSRLHGGTILKLRKGADVEKLIQSIQIRGDNSQMYLKNLGVEIQQNIKSNSYTEIPQIILGLSFILFSVIGIVATTFISIMMRKREFGVKLVLGESKYGLFIQILLENLLIGIVGMGLSLIHFIWKYSGLLKISNEFNLASALDFKMNASIVFPVFSVLLLVMILSNLIVFLFIRNLEPKSLIGGME
ncbi:ABC transporter permease [Neobacillus sp. SM06]|uniref:ABC transporter permease n=1 Tax=Neobacillus sp. SM06 TaxID=3422492 RepID=UPI003D28A40D